MDYTLERIPLAEQPVTLLAREEYCVLICIQGSCLLNDTRQRHLLSAGQLALLAPDNHLTASRVNTIPVELLLLRLPFALLRQLSTAQTDLLAGFGYREYRCAVIVTPHSIFMLVQNICRRLLSASAEEVRYGQDIFEQNLLSVVIVLVLRACVTQDKAFTGKLRSRFVIDDVFAYVKNHLAEPITLEHLASVFYMSKAHISREFKKQCGETVHRYILKARLELCCKQLLQGKSVSEVYGAAGFHDYNNFFRTFRQFYGVTPKQYVSGMRDTPQ